MVRAGIAALGVVLAATVLQAVAAGTAHAQESCTEWVDVTNSEPDSGDGYVNDRHGLVWTQTQTCTTSDGQVRYARATYEQLAEDSWPYEQEGMELRIYDFSDECHGCDTIWSSGTVPEPGVGNRHLGDRVPIEAGRHYGTDVHITYVNPPSPYYLQSGHLNWFG